MRQNRLRFLLVVLVLTVSFLLDSAIHPTLSAASATNDACEQLGWFPEDFRLKDHSVFTFDETYYLVSIHLPGEKRFAYARSSDLCNWETLPWLLAERRPGTWDEMAVWAPHVFEDGGVYFMYYTGVTNDFTQSIMLATTGNPADASTWVEEGVIFQPDHIGMVWEAGTWADARDPSVLKLGSTYYLYYTGLDHSGPIVGLATAPSPRGPWRDWGSVLSFEPGVYAESATMYNQGELFYLFYNNIYKGEMYQIGASPGGPWTDPVSIAPGWAHEVWRGLDGSTYTSYLTTYKVSISPLTWDTFVDPARPLIGEYIYQILLPAVLSQGDG